MVAFEFSKNAPDFTLPDWITIKELDNIHETKAMEFAQQIDEGESSAIALFLQIQASWLLCDDTKARHFAESYGLEVHVSIGLLLWGVAANHLANRNEAIKLLDALADSSLWVSARVLQEARNAINLIYSRKRE